MSEGEGTMAKWNPFDKQILNADPDEFAGSGEAGYGVPRDADSLPAAGEDPALAASEDPARAVPGGQGTNGSGSFAMPDQRSAEGPQDVHETAAGAPAGDMNGEVQPAGGNETNNAIPSGQEQGWNAAAPGQEASGTNNAIPFGQDLGMSGQSAGSTQSNPPEPGASVPPDTGGMNAFGGGRHDFEDDEPKYDTQTGERLDKPKKKLPAMLLTAAVSIVAVAAFVYAIKPGSLPSRKEWDGKEPTETETRLAVARQESESQSSDGAKAQTGDPENKANSKAQTEDAAKTEAQSKSGEQETSQGMTQKTDQPQEETQAQASLKAQAETKSETERKAKTESKPETEQKAKKETKPETEQKAKTETKPETERKARTETKPGTEQKTQAETKASGSLKAQAETEPQAQTDMETELHLPPFKAGGITVSASLDVSDMVEKAMPSVVSVTCSSVQTVLDFFYGQQQIRQTDAGSGIIVRRDADHLYIVTDASIVNDAQEITVGFCVEKDQTKELADDDTFAPASLLGIDKDSMLAVIKVPLDEIHETVQSLVGEAALGDSDSLRVGERAIAIGNAMGRGLSVTQGIISAVNRPMRYGSGVHSFIQTDASINYGNYGGALLNEDGEVIGINAGKVTEHASEGMGYAFPINDAKEVISRMVEGSETLSDGAKEDSAGTKEDREQKETEKGQRETEKEQRETLALALAQEESETSASDQAQSDTALSPAEPQAGEQSQTEDGHPKEGQAQTEGQAQKPGQLQTEGLDAAPSHGQLGVQVGEFSKEDQIIYRIPAGVVVAEVMNGSGAQAAGLAAGDLITKINETPVASVVQLKDALSGFRAGDKVSVSFLRPDEEGIYREENQAAVTVTLQ